MVRLSALMILFVTHLACAQSAPDAAAPFKREPSNADLRPATLIFVVKPWGEVLIDGETHGVSPPLKSIKVSPGERAIIIKNASFAAYADTIIVKPGEERTIQHTFAN